MEAGALTVEDLLNFNLGDDFIKQNTQKSLNPFSDALALPDFAEEELEWLSNKDAFPSLESCLDILNHHSPVSVLDNLNSHKKNIIKKHNYVIPLRYPMKPRTNHRRRRSCFPDPPTQHFAKPQNQNPNQNQNESQNQKGCVVMGRRCMHCQVDKTPQWRAGPAGPKTLCNACGVRYKSGRLVPEYRPANSPTFSSVLHSNSHRKVVEMRREKVLGGAAVNEPCVYSRPGSCGGERRSRG